MLDYQAAANPLRNVLSSKYHEGIIGSASRPEVMNISINHKVLFLQGGAPPSLQCTLMNLMTKSGKADFVLTGQWATKAYKEAAR